MAQSVRGIADGTLSWGADSCDEERPACEAATIHYDAATLREAIRVADEQAAKFGPLTATGARAVSHALARLLMSVAVALALSATPSHGQILTSGRLTTAGATCDLPTSCVQVGISTTPSIGIGLSGTWTGTVWVEASTDGITWRRMLFKNTANNNSVNQVASNGIYALANVGYITARVRANTLSAGSVVVFIARGELTNVG